MGYFHLTVMIANVQSMLNYTISDLCTGHIIRLRQFIHLCEHHFLQQYNKKGVFKEQMLLYLSEGSNFITEGKE